ncbi:Unknown protein [Striga hermonthica]|uniref:KIB1-4 beta-propeller domain-containing protein n=1 Tax=Striga hermonthica TaxID=68872 RepID=A0A9N7RR59_STRHE|nr:Unknown protein [Striga hermonthica]
MASICRKGLAGFSTYLIFGKWKAGSSPSSVHELCSRFRVYPIGAARRMSTVADTVISDPTDQKIVSLASPWLMLPPVFECGSNAAPTTRYKFCSLLEDRVVSTAAKNAFMGDLMDIVGSSHGWLSLLNPNTLDMFLYNPFSGCYVKLPPLHNLPAASRYSPMCVDKVILSCSPDDDEQNCRVIMIYNCPAAMAYCCPGSSKEWTCIVDGETSTNVGWYKNCVYSKEHQLLFALTSSFDLVSWDLGDPLSPSLVDCRKMDFPKTEEEKKLKGFPKTEEEKKLWRPTYLTCETVEHLVAAGEDLLLVTQYVLMSVLPDGLYIDSNNDPTGSIYEQCFPYVTIDFDVERYDPATAGVKCVEDSFLGGWALFVGYYSDAVALPVAHYPEGIKPGSIYFTDVMGAWIGEDPSGGHDVGIFNYQNKTVSPCYYPCDAQSLKKSCPAPMYFPSRG